MKSLKQINSKLIEHSFGPILTVPTNGSAMIVGQTEVGQQYVFPYYDDEITVFQTEILGKTREEIVELIRKKDVQYLRS